MNPVPTAEDRTPGFVLPPHPVAKTSAYHHPTSPPHHRRHRLRSVRRIYTRLRRIASKPYRRAGTQPPAAVSLHPEFDRNPTHGSPTSSSWVRPGRRLRTTFPLPRTCASARPSLQTARGTCPVAQWPESETESAKPA